MEKIYFLSGTMCTEDLWQFTFPKIEKYIPVHIDISPATSFDEINQILLSIITKPAILIGFSLGGFSALNFASKYPNKVKRLIVIAASAKGLSKHEIRLRKSTIDFLKTHQYKGISKARVLQFLHKNNHQNQSLIAIIKKMDADLGKNILIKQLQATSSRVDITNQLAQIKTPILLIGANEDELVKKEAIIDLKKVLQNGLSIMIKHCGHMIPLEKPEELASIINRYLDEK